MKTYRIISIITLALFAQISIASAAEKSKYPFPITAEGKGFHVKITDAFWGQPTGDELLTHGSPIGLCVHYELTGDKTAPFQITEKNHGIAFFDSQDNNIGGTHQRGHAYGTHIDPSWTSVRMNFGIIDPAAGTVQRGPYYEILRVIIPLTNLRIVHNTGPNYPNIFAKSNDVSTQLLSLFSYHGDEPIYLVKIWFPNKAAAQPWLIGTGTLSDELGHTCALSGASLEFNPPEPTFGWRPVPKFFWKDDGTRITGNEVSMLFEFRTVPPFVMGKTLSISLYPATDNEYRHDFVFHNIPASTTDNTAGTIPEFTATETTPRPQHKPSKMTLSSLKSAKAYSEIMVWFAIDPPLSSLDSLVHTEITSLVDDQGRNFLAEPLPFAPPIRKPWFSVKSVPADAKSFSMAIHITEQERSISAQGLTFSHITAPPQSSHELVIP